MKDMPRNPKRKGQGASTSFTPKQVETGCLIFDALLRGGDVEVLLRSPEGLKLIQKFHNMRRSIKERRSGI